MKIRHPSPEELYALERAARRLRAEEMARLGRACVAMVRSLYRRIVSVRRAKGLRHA